MECFLRQYQMSQLLSVKQHQVSHLMVGKKTPADNGLLVYRTLQLFHKTAQNSLMDVHKKQMAA
jgi:predicted XRE-type DNA-binding protein